MRHSLTSMKKLSIALGIAGIGVLTGLPALAQSPSQNGSQEFRESQEIMMSNEGMKILCSVTPINSRCEGSPYYNAGASSQPVESSTTTSPDGTTAPTQNLPSESDMPSPSGMTDRMSPGMMQGGSSSGSDGNMTSPSGTTAPTQNLPSETDAPVAPSQSPSGTMQDGSSPGSSGTTTSPSGTTAPTQTLPSEGPVPSPMSR